MKISVIIPVLNEEKNILPALTRLQTIAGLLPDYDWEFLIVDGGSIDKTAELAAGFPAVSLLPTSPGRGGQLHAGARAATGGLLVFLHVDARVEADYFRQASAALAAGRGWGCAHVVFADEQGRRERGIFDLIAFFSNLRVRRSAIAFGDQSIFCSASFYARHGGFEPEYFFFEDYRFCQRARSLERPVFLPARCATSSRRHRRQGVGKTLWRMQKARWQYLAGKPLAKIWEDYQR